MYDKEDGSSSRGWIGGSLEDTSEISGENTSEGTCGEGNRGVRRGVKGGSSSNIHPQAETNEKRNLSLE